MNTLPKHIVLFGLVTLSALTQAQPRLEAQPYMMQRVGQHVSGTYKAVGDPIIFVVAEWRGDFTRQNARQTFDWAVAANRSEGVTAAAANEATSGDSARNQRRTLAPDRHLVVGWYNTTRDEFHFFAISMKSSTEIWYGRHDGLEGQSSGWVTPKTYSNGQLIRINFADDDNGGAAWRFSFE